MMAYGARAVPKVFLESPLQSCDERTDQGAWNAARFNNKSYDRLSKAFIAAVDLPRQRRLATQVELLLVDETPIIHPFVYDGVTATQKDIHGVYPTEFQLFFLGRLEDVYNAGSEWEGPRLLAPQLDRSLGDKCASGCETLSSVASQRKREGASSCRTAFPH